MSKIRYISHPDVEIDPATPVQRWNLSREGRARATAMLSQPWIGHLTAIISSDETKALELAEVVSSETGLQIDVRPGTGENDRSSTGFVSGERFARLVEHFFGSPHESIEGWERSVDAQRRIVAELDDLLGSDNGEIAVIGHGGVGTLWYCHLTGEPIDQQWDQPGQGHYFTVDRPSGLAEHWWLPIDVAATS